MEINDILTFHTNDQNFIFIDRTDRVGVLVTVMSDKRVLIAIALDDTLRGVPPWSSLFQINKFKLKLHCHWRSMIFARL